MSGIARPLKEIIDRHSLNPDLCDVYVEGTSDKGLLDRFFEECGRTEVNVYEIATVEVPATLVRKLGLENNNRGRVIALARVLYEELDGTSQARGVVDADLSYVLEEKESCPLVFMTDYTSMEMYFFNSKSLKKFILAACPSLGISAVDLLDTISPILEKLFYARVANRVLAWNLRSVPFARSCKVIVKPFRVRLDLDNYIKRYLEKNGRMKHLKEFTNTLKRWQKKSALIDARYRIHGHDFLEVVGLCCSKIKAAAEFNSANLVGAVLRSGLSCSELTSEQLFEALLEQYPPP